MTRRGGDDVWARAAADRSGSVLLVGLVPFVLTLVLKATVTDELALALDRLGAGQRALTGVAGGLLLTLPVVLWVAAHRADRASLPLRLQSWLLLCLLLCTVLWVPGRGRAVREELVLDRAGWAIVTLAVTTAVVLLACLRVLLRRPRTG